MWQSFCGFLLLVMGASVLARPADSPPVPDLPDAGGSTFKRIVVVGWADGESPSAPPGFRVELWADGFSSGRWP